MNTGGEAAEQIVRMSLEGFEVAAKITGAGAKNIAILLYTILKEEKKTKGKSRLTNMLRSGNEETISGVLDGIVTPEDEDSETCPSEDTMITTAPPLFRTAEGR